MAPEYRNNVSCQKTSAFVFESPFGTPWALIAIVNVATCRWPERFPTPPSPPPLCNPIALPIFPALLQLALVSLSSRIKPLLEMRLEAFEHLFFYVFYVGKPAPTSDIAVFRCTLNLHNKFFH